MEIIKRFSDESELNGRNTLQCVGGSTIHIIHSLINSYILERKLRTATFCNVQEWTWVRPVRNALLCNRSTSMFSIIVCHARLKFNDRNLHFFSCDCRINNINIDTPIWRREITEPYYVYRWKPVLVESNFYFHLNFFEIVISFFFCFCIPDMWLFCCFGTTAHRVWLLIGFVHYEECVFHVINTQNNDVSPA